MRAHDSAGRGGASIVSAAGTAPAYGDVAEDDTPHAPVTRRRLRRAILRNTSG